MNWVWLTYGGVVSRKNLYGHGRTGRCGCYGPETCPLAAQFYERRLHSFMRCFTKVIQSLPFRQVGVGYGAFANATEYGNPSFIHIPPIHQHFHINPPAFSYQSTSYSFNITYSYVYHSCWWWNAMMLHISRRFTYPGMLWSHVWRITGVLLYSHINWRKCYVHIQV